MIIYKKDDFDLKTTKKKFVYIFVCSESQVEALDLKTTLKDQKQMNI